MKELMLIPGTNEFGRVLYIHEISNIIKTDDGGIPEAGECLGIIKMPHEGQKALNKGTMLFISNALEAMKTGRWIWPFSNNKVASVDKRFEYNYSEEEVFERLETFADD
jgi:hypothetical protein